MNSDRDHLERLISRRLDGMLTEEERLELDRLVLRDPQARRLLETHRRLEHLAAEAIEEACGESEIAFDPASLATGRAAASRAHHWAWWLMPLAAAAALMLVVLIPPHITQPPGAGHDLTDGTPLVETKAEPRRSRGPVGDIGLVRAGNPKIERKTDRELIGIVGDDGAVYWIEVDRTKTLRGPGTQSLTKLTSGNM